MPARRSSRKSHCYRRKGNKKRGSRRYCVEEGHVGLVACHQGGCSRRKSRSSRKRSSRRRRRSSRKH